MALETSDLNSRTVAGLLAYCEWLTAKGYATSAQVNPWRTATQKVFETVEGEGWESLDLTTIDLDEYLARFQTLAGAQYKAESITAYKRRIRNAMDAHEHYLANGRPPTFRQGARRAKAEERGSVETDQDGSVVPLESKTQPQSKVGGGSSSGGMIDFPWPLKGGRMALLRIPARLHSDDVNRMSAFLRTLQDDQAEQRQIPRHTGADSKAA
jgi:hypothetical protein